MNYEVPFLEDADHITAEWMTAVLSPAYPGAVVKAVFAGTVIHGTATKVRLMLTYNEAGLRHGLPPTMWLKCGFHANSAEIDLGWLYANEASFYREFAPGLDIEHAKAFAAVTHPTTGQSILLLEDLLARQAEFQSAPHPITPALAAQVLTWQAKLHARHWGSPELKARPWLNNGMQLKTIDTMMSEALWEQCMALPRSAMIPPAIRDFQKVREGILHMMRSDAANACCIVHGDTHLGNVYVTPTGAGYADWQCVHHSLWAQDVADFLTTAMTVEDRRHAEQDLIDHYVKAVGELGVRLDFAEAWLQYRRHALYNLTWIFNLPEWQPDTINLPNIERGCAAVMDLEAFEAW